MANPAVTNPAPRPPVLKAVDAVKIADAAVDARFPIDPTAFADGFGPDALAPVDMDFEAKPDPKADPKTLIKRSRSWLAAMLEHLTAKKTDVEKRIGEIEQRAKEGHAEAQKAFDDATATIKSIHAMDLADANADLHQIEHTKEAMDAALARLNKAEA